MKRILMIIAAVLMIAAGSYAFVMRDNQPEKMDCCSDQGTEQCSPSGCCMGGSN